MTHHQALFLPANSRKFKDFGFMQAYLSFKPDLSEERHSFGSLITIDDAILKAGAKGFGLHSHQDVEVVTFVVQGEVKHIDPDNAMHTGTLSAKGIQVITAGTGIVHNEENNSADDELHALQIWFKTKENGITPSYAKKSLKVSDYTNQLTCILSPNGENDSPTVQQDAFIYYCLSNTPGLLTSYQVTVDAVVDFRRGYSASEWNPLWEDFYCDWRELWFNQHIEPPSWLIGDTVIAAGASGVLFHSSLLTGGTNLVLFPKTYANSDSIAVYDPDHSLPKYQDSWT